MIINSVNDYPVDSPWNPLSSRLQQGLRIWLYTLSITLDMVGRDQYLRRNLSTFQKPHSRRKRSEASYLTLWTIHFFSSLPLPASCLSLMWLPAHLPQPRRSCRRNSFCFQRHFRSTPIGISCPLQPSSKDSVFPSSSPSLVRLSAWHLQHLWHTDYPDVIFWEETSLTLSLYFPCCSAVAWFPPF